MNSTAQAKSPINERASRQFQLLKIPDLNIARERFQDPRTVTCMPRIAPQAEGLMKRMEKKANEHGLYMDNAVGENAMQHRIWGVPEGPILHTETQLLAGLASFATGRLRMALDIRGTVFFGNNSGVFDGKALDEIMLAGGARVCDPLCPDFMRPMSSTQFLGAVLLQLTDMDGFAASQFLRGIFKTNVFDGKLVREQTDRDWAEKYTGTQLAAAFALAHMGKVNNSNALLGRAERIVDMLHAKDGPFRDGLFYPSMDDQGKLGYIKDGRTVHEIPEWIKVGDQLLAVLLYREIGLDQEASAMMKNLMSLQPFDGQYFQSGYSISGGSSFSPWENRASATQFLAVLAMNELGM